MSVTFAKVRDRVVGRIRDTDPQASTYAPPEIDQAIAENYLLLQSALPAPELHTASAFTISAGGNTFTLPSTVTSYDGAEYAGDIRLQLVSNNRFMHKRSVEEIDALRNMAPTTFLSVPYCFALWEDKAGLVQGRCYPGALAAEAVNMFHSLMSDDVRDFTATDLDTASVLFSRIAADALVLFTSADLLLRMTPKELERRNINPQVAKLWLDKANDLILREAGRRHSLDDTGRLQRWVP